jgi:hypothetical protein
VDKFFCGHGGDEVWYGGRTADPSDVIHESCEEAHFGASRTEFRTR